jgi:hypothetical protein
MSPDSGTAATVLCPACGAPATRAVRGKGRWECRESGCPVSEFTETYPSRPGRAPGPRADRRQRRATKRCGPAPEASKNEGAMGRSLDDQVSASI